MKSDIQWLLDRWQLPAAAIPAVEALLQAEDNGSTAVTIDPNSAKILQEVFTHNNAPLRVMELDDCHYLQATTHQLKETAIRECLLKAANSDPLPLPYEFESVCKQLFPAASAEDPQLQALRKAWERPICCITGGPGTGKTYTLARILALFEQVKQSDSDSPYPYFLCAPTGKAAQRMRDAMIECLNSMQADLSEGSRQHLSDAANNASTLHRLLGYNPATMACRLKRLPEHAVVVVDECSMLDLNLWHALLSKLPTHHYHLILLGDPQQLESIGLGDILNSFFKVVKDPSHPLQPQLQRIHTELTSSYRFRGQPALAALADTLRTGDSAKALELLAQHTDPAAPGGLYWQAMAGSGLTIDELASEVKQRISAIALAADPESVIKAMRNAAILSAHNNDWNGTRGLNRQINAYVAKLGNFRNQPIIINTNDPETGLRNGTVGILHNNEQGQRLAWFPKTDGSLQSFPLSRLPDYQPAWAITIHRSQGSEYDTVCVMLPQAESPLANRALLYTAITRARKKVYLYGSADAIDKAIRTQSTRLSLIFRRE